MILSYNVHARTGRFHGCECFSEIYVFFHLISCPLQSWQSLHYFVLYYVFVLFSFFSSFYTSTSLSCPVVSLVRIDCLFVLVRTGFVSMIVYLSGHVVHGAVLSVYVAEDRDEVTANRKIPPRSDYRKCPRTHHAMLYVKPDPKSQQSSYKRRIVKLDPRVV